MMGYNNYRGSNNWYEINQIYHGHSGKIKTRAQSKLHHRSKREIPSKIDDSPFPTNLVATDAGTPSLNRLAITGIVIGSLIGLTIIISCLIFIKKRKNSSEDEEEGELPTNPRELNSLTNTSSAPANKNDNDRKSIESVPVEVSENTKKSSEENINKSNEYVPQYYNGMKIPPLGARIISLERQMQIAKESTWCNLSLTNSTTNTTNNNYYNNSNSSTTEV